jgi:hypothetical protein
MNGITFIREQGGLGRRLPGEDHVSAIVLYGFAFSRMDVRSLEEAVQNGLTTENKLPYYHIAEFFRVASGARLIIKGEADYDNTFTAVKELQQYAQGAIRQIGIWAGDEPLSLADVTALNTVCDDLAAINMPLSAVLSPKLSSQDLPLLPALSSANAPRVSVVIAQDGGGYGATLDIDCIGIIGACMGAIAKARVHESIGWVERQNMVSVAYPKNLNGGVEMAKELDIPAFADGTLLNDLTPLQQEQINTKGYLFLRKHVGIAGSFFNDSFTATAADSDYHFIENNRSIDKAVRGVYGALLPKVSGVAYIDPETGTLTADFVGAMEAIAEAPLAQMQRDGELSGYLVRIDPDQPILQTSKMAVTIKLVPVGVLREIVVSIGFTLNINL